MSLLNGRKKSVVRRLLTHKDRIPLDFAAWASTIFYHLIINAKVSFLRLNCKLHLYMWSICQKEINQFFSSLTGYIAIILFLLINGIFLFLLKDSSILDFGYASLDNFFELAPWVLLFLVPSLTMRTFSEEFRAGTFEIIKTMPVTELKIVVGKYIAVLVLILFSILPTLIYVFTIHSLSQTTIDSGGISGSYAGLFLLASTFASIGLFCSSLTNNGVVAFLLSAFVCLLLYFGFNALSKIQVFQGNADYYIEMLGIDFHYRSISRGVLDSRDVVYFFSLIVLTLYGTSKNLATNK